MYKIFNTVVARLVLTHTENVKTKSLCDRFTDELVREAVEPNMAAQTQVTLLFILKDTNKTKQNKTLKAWLHVRKTHMGKTLVRGRKSCLLKPSHSYANEH